MSAYNPTFRQRTGAFHELRSKFASSRPRNPPSTIQESSGSNESHVPFLDPTQQPTKKSKHHHDDVRIPMMSLNITPVWFQYVELIDDNLHKIELQIGELKEYQSLRQSGSVMFDDNKANEYDINIQEITHSVTSLLKSSKLKLQQIGIKNNDESENLGFEEKAARYNAMKSRAMKLQQFTKQFHHLQREFIKNMSIKDTKSTQFENVTNTLPDLSNVYAGYTQEQQQIIDEMANESEERTKAIAAVCTSVHELAQLFQDLSVLIVEQGSLLDRIDYNVEQTLDNLSKAKVHVDKASVHQKRSGTALCIIVLIMLILLAGFILIIKELAK